MTPHRLMFEQLISGWWTVGKGLGSVTLLEVVGHWRGVLRFPKATPCPVSSLCLVLVDEMGLCLQL